MEVFQYKGKTYEVDTQGFLIDYNQWDEDFAQGMAPNVNIPGALTEKHWDLIRFIRDSFKQTGECPLVYKTCKANRLSAKGLKELFPTGYMRGACKLAGITHRDRIVNYYGEESPEIRLIAEEERARIKMKEKVYRVDIFGFLIDPSEWDENFAAHKAKEMKMTEGLTEKHRKIIQFLRNSYQKNKVLPTIFECCEANQIDVEELERLFPDGYHRGAVKIAGLRVR